MMPSCKPFSSCSRKSARDTKLSVESERAMAGGKKENAPAGTGWLPAGAFDRYSIAQSAA